MIYFSINLNLLFVFLDILLDKGTSSRNFYWLYLHIIYQTAHFDTDYCPNMLRLTYLTWSSKENMSTKYMMKLS